MFESPDCKKNCQKFRQRYICIYTAGSCRSELAKIVVNTLFNDPPSLESDAKKMTLASYTPGTIFLSKY